MKFFNIFNGSIALCYILGTWVVEIQGASTDILFAEQAFSTKFVTTVSNTVSAKQDSRLNGNSVTVTEAEDCSLCRGERVTFDDELDCAYTIISDRSEDNMGISVLHAAQPVYSYKAHQLKPCDSLPPGVAMPYDRLANRAGKPQPKPFDDILGNGLPDLVINEYVVTGNNTETYTNMLTIISLDGTNVVETPGPLCRGEVIYFKDFNDDGCMEVVNTDREQGFRQFDNDGVPMHKGVWKYDPEAGRYRENGTENPYSQDK